MKTRHWLLTLWVLIVFVLHQDLWNWTKVGPLLFGLLPPVLTYHLGYSVLAALFWRRSNKWGALAAVLWVVCTMALLWWLQLHSHAIAPKPGQPPVPIFAEFGGLFLRTPMNVTIFGYMPVMFMCLGSAFWMMLVSLLTPAPSRATVAKFFPSSLSTHLSST